MAWAGCWNLWRVAEWADEAGKVWIQGVAQGQYVVKDWWAVNGVLVCVAFDRGATVLLVCTLDISVVSFS